MASADLVQENGPERIDFKKKLYGQLDDLLPPEVIIASSSSGLIMSEIQSGCPSHPERCVIAHPFNPPHLVPLVEIVGGAKTSETLYRVVDGKDQPLVDTVGYASFGFGYRRCADEYITMEFIKEFLRKVSKDKLSFVKLDIENSHKAPVNPGTVLVDNIAFKRVK